MREINEAALQCVYLLDQHGSTHANQLETWIRKTWCKVQTDLTRWLQGACRVSGIRGIVSQTLANGSSFLMTCLAWGWPAAIEDHLGCKYISCEKPAFIDAKGITSAAWFRASSISDGNLMLFFQDKHPKHLLHRGCTLGISDNHEADLQHATAGGACTKKPGDRRPPSDGQEYPCTPL